MKTTLLKIKNYAKNNKGIVWASGLGVAALALAVSFFVYSASYARVLPNIEVQGINIGGMTVTDAEKALDARFGQMDTDRELTFCFGDNQKTLNLEAFGAKAESKKTAEAAFKIGRDGGVFKKTGKIFALAFKGETVPLNISLDEDLLEDTITEIADGGEVSAVPTHYELEENTLTIVRGHGGKMIDRKKAFKRLQEAVLDKSINKLDFEIEEVPLESTDLDKFYEEITAPMKNAEYSLKEGEVEIIPEKIGIIVDKQLLKTALDSGQERYSLKVETVKPEMTKADLEKLLFRDNMGTWTSDFSTSSEARASNVMLTAKRIDGVILMPGDEFSYDKTVGSRTRANGYREAGVYIGNKVESGIGGGICQTSSTLYSAVLYANLEIVSRTSHSLPVSYMPPGQDATIAEGYIDFKFKNNTDYPIKISATVKGRKLTCSILGVKEDGVLVEIVHSRTATYKPETERKENPEIPQGYRYITNKGAEGYAVASSRIVKKSGEVIKTEKLTRSVYKAAPIEEEVNPLDKETPSENLKIYTPGMKILQEGEEAPSESPEENAQDEPEVKEDISTDENNVESTEQNIETGTENTI